MIGYLSRKVDGIVSQDSAGFFSLDCLTDGGKKGMKKSLAALMILLSVFAALYAGFGFVADISPYFTFDNTPVGIEGLSWRNE